VDTAVWRWGLKEVLEDINAFKPNMIVIDTSSLSSKNDLSVAEIIKSSFPKVRLVMVGAPASQLAERMLSSLGIGIVARWEFDFTLKDLTLALAQESSLHQVKGISFKGNGRIHHNPDHELSTSEDLDKIPFVSMLYKKHLNVKDYMLNYSRSMHPMVQIFTARGCPFRCTFCSWPQTLMGKKYKVRSVSNVLHEFEWVKKEFKRSKADFHRRRYFHCG